MNRTSLKVAVVGAGIVGVSCAEYLRRDGHQVTLYDPVPPGDPAQTSYGNVGMLVPSSITPVATPSMLRRLPRMLIDRDSPLFLRWRDFPRLAPFLLRFAMHANERDMERIVPAVAALTADSPREHLSLAHGTPAEAYFHESDIAHLYLNNEHREKDRAIIELRRQLGIPSTDLESNDVGEIDSKLEFAYRCGVRYPSHGYISDPGAYVAALAQHYVSAGGELRKAAVDNVSQTSESHVALQVQGEQLVFNRAVLCTGHRSGHWMRKFGLRLSLASERGYHLALQDMSSPPAIPCLLQDAKVGVSPMQGGVRIGGLVEFAHRDAPPSRQPIAALHRLARRLYPDAPWERAKEWMGSRPTTVDSLPVIGQVPKNSNILMAFGTQHIGMTTGPRIGRCVAKLLEDGMPDIDLVPYRPGRFARGH